MEPQTIKINEVEYIRKDSVPSGHNIDGMPYVIVRSRDQGVMCGYLAKREGDEAVLIQARQIWRFDSAFTLVELVENGMRNPANNMLSCAMSNPVTMIGICGVLPCTAPSARGLIDHPATVKK